MKKAIFFLTLFLLLGADMKASESCGATVDPETACKGKNVGDSCTFTGQSWGRHGTGGKWVIGHGACKKVPYGVACVSNREEPCKK